MTVLESPSFDLLDDPATRRPRSVTAIPKASRIEEPPQEPEVTQRVPPKTLITSADVEKALMRMRQTSTSTLQRVHTLRLVMAGLEGITFEEAARLLDVRPSRLAAWLQGTGSIPKSKDRLLADLYEMLRLLHQLVPRAQTGRWMRLPIPALGGTTPYDALVQGRVQEVLRVTQRYTESSFV